MNIADNVVANGVKLDTAITKLDAIATAVAGISGGGGTPTDLTPVLAAIAEVKAEVTASPVPVV